MSPFCRTIAFILKSGLPAFVQDGASAVRWVREHIAVYGGDPNAIFLMGHSAGAHIAGMLALSDRYLQTDDDSRRWVRGFVGLSGPYAIDIGASPNSAGICAFRVQCTQLLSSIFHAPYSSQDWQPNPSEEAALPPTLLLTAPRIRSSFCITRRCCAIV